jgi:hypothetical protein
LLNYGRLASERHWDMGDNWVEMKIFKKVKTRFLDRCFEECSRSVSALLMAVCAVSRFCLEKRQSGARKVSLSERSLAVLCKRLSWISSIFVSVRPIQTRFWAMKRPHEILMNREWTKFWIRSTFPPNRIGLDSTYYSIRIRK